MSRPISLQIEGKEKQHFESVPDAIAACRRHFMAGERSPCTVIQDHLIYTVNVSPDWDGTGLP